MVNSPEGSWALRKIKTISVLSLEMRVQGGSSPRAEQVSEWPWESQSLSLGEGQVKAGKDCGSNNIWIWISVWLFHNCVVYRSVPLDLVFSARNIEKTKRNNFLGLFSRTLWGLSGYKQGASENQCPQSSSSARSCCLTPFPGGLPIAAAQSVDAPYGLPIVK